jgi:hypothetical protein
MAIIQQYSGYQKSAQHEEYANPYSPDTVSRIPQMFIQNQRDRHTPKPIKFWVIGPRQIGHQTRPSRAFSSRFANYLFGWIVQFSS